MKTRVKLTGVGRPETATVEVSELRDGRLFLEASRPRHEGPAISLTPDEARQVAAALDPPRENGGPEPEPDEVPGGEAPGDIPPVPREQYDLLVSAIEQAGGEVEDGLVTMPDTQRYIAVSDGIGPHTVVDTKTNRILGRVSSSFARFVVDGLNSEEEVA